MPHLDKFNLDFWLVFASYCNKFFKICQPNVFNIITSGNNKKNTKIINMGQENEQNQIYISLKSCII